MPGAVRDDESGRYNITDLIMFVGLPAASAVAIVVTGARATTYAVALISSAGIAVHTTPLSTAQADIFRHCQISPPPAITAPDPA